LPSTTSAPRSTLPTPVSQTTPATDVTRPTPRRTLARSCPIATASAAVRTGIVTLRSAAFIGEVIRRPIRKSVWFRAIPRSESTARIRWSRRVVGRSVPVARVKAWKKRVAPSMRTIAKAKGEIPSPPALRGPMTIFPSTACDAKATWTTRSAA